MVGYGEVETFGKLLAGKRRGKPRILVATMCHVSGTTVTAWEDGRSFPGDEKLLEISVAYDIPTAELVATLKTSRDERKRETSERRPAKARYVDTRIAFYSKFNSLRAGTGT